VSNLISVLVENNALMYFSPLFCVRARGPRNDFAAPCRLIIGLNERVTLRFVYLLFIAFVMGMR